MALPVNIDSTYDDDGTDASVKEHQQHHDALHAQYNDWENAGPPIVDTASNLAASNPVPVAGQTVYASDTEQMALGDGTTAWADLPKFEPAGARELAYAESTTQQTGIGATIVDLTGLQIDFDVVVRPVMVSIYLPWVTASAANGFANIYLRNVSDSTTVVQTVSGYIGGAANVQQVYLEHRFNSPGSYSVKVSMNKTGTPTVGNGANLAILTSNIRAMEL